MHTAGVWYFFIATSAATAQAKLIPVVFAAGLLLPSTTKEITPQRTAVEKQFKKHFENGTSVILLHNMGKENNPWLGVKGTIIEHNIKSTVDDDKSTPKTTFTVSLTDVVKVYKPYKSIRVVETKYDDQGDDSYEHHYVEEALDGGRRGAVFIEDASSERAVSTLLNELIFPGFQISLR